MSDQNLDTDKENRNRMELDIPDIDGAALTNVIHSDLGISSPFMKEIYLRKQAIVGTRFQGGSDELVEDLEAGSRVTFLREPDNPFDPNAVMALDDQGRKLGYIPRRENELISALMEVGKYFYGVIPDKPKENPNTHNRTPGSIWTDLYMKEFALPEDLSEIPLQGYRGSYAVLDLQIRGEEGIVEKEIKEESRDSDLSSRRVQLFVIKVIHGEEKNTFSRTYIPGTADNNTNDNDETNGPSSYIERLDVIRDYNQLVCDLDHYIGHLPVVGHDLAGKKTDYLQDAYGIILGKPFSNHLIDTLQMAKNHLPLANGYSLTDLADQLGIDVHCQNPGEERCRTIWQLYRRMERSELEKKAALVRTISPEITGMNPGAETSTIKIAKVINLPDTPLIDLRMTAICRWILLENGIDTMRELSRLTAEDVNDFNDMTEEVFKETEDLLSQMGMQLRPDDSDPFLYGYPEHIRKIIDDKKEYWKYILYYEVLAQNFSWLDSFDSFRYREDYPKIPIGHEKLDDGRKMNHFLVEQMEFLRDLILACTAIFNDEEEAFGTGGSDPNPVLIVKMAETMIEKYKSLIHWMVDMRRYDMNPVYKEGFREFLRFGDDIAETFDLLKEQAQTFPDKVYQYYRGEITEDDIPTDMGLSMALKDDHYKMIHDIISEEYDIDQ